MNYNDFDKNKYDLDSLIEAFKKNSKECVEREIKYRKIREEQCDEKYNEISNLDFYNVNQALLTICEEIKKLKERQAFEDL